MNIISAISIARRLNDPLNEFVKVEPKHLGVGMYQHDLNEKVLSETLDEVVMECVSFVGVDINTASKDILSHVAGLTNLRAEKILSYREENGPFRNRKDLLKVKSIGEKIFSQCAGWVHFLNYFLNSCFNFNFFVDLLKLMKEMLDQNILINWIRRGYIPKVMISLKSKFTLVLRIKLPLIILPANKINQLFSELSTN